MTPKDHSPLVPPRGNATDLAGLFRDAGSLFAFTWASRRQRIVGAIEGYAWDLDAVGRLLVLLGHEAPLVPSADDRQQVRAARRDLRLLDRLLAREVATPTGLLEVPAVINLLCRVWTSLEICFLPDERSPLEDLRDLLVREADRREIDLRGHGI